MHQYHQRQVDLVYLEQNLMVLEYPDYLVDHRHLLYLVVLEHLQHLDLEHPVDQFRLDQLNLVFLDGLAYRIQLDRHRLAALSHLEYLLNLEHLGSQSQLGHRHLERLAFLELLHLQERMVLEYLADQNRLDHQHYLQHLVIQ